MDGYHTPSIRPNLRVTCVSLKANRTTTHERFHGEVRSKTLKATQAIEHERFVLEVRFFARPGSLYVPQSTNCSLWCVRDPMLSVIVLGRAQ